MGTLNGKVAIVTGGASGIGLAAAKLFAEEAGSVFLVDREADALNAVASSFHSDRVAAHVADVSDPNQVKGYVKACVQRFGGVDILIDNAGIEGKMATLLELSPDDFEKVQSVNVKGVWYGIKYAAPEMIKRGGGSIVLTSSVAGLIGSKGMGAYVTSKHAVIGLMRTAALELAADNIRVNSVHPGPIETQMMRRIEKVSSPDAPETVKAGFTSQVPLGRYGKPEEIAQLMLFLASDAASYCTGGTYVADGGFTTQ